MSETPELIFLDSDKPNMLKCRIIGDDGGKVFAKHFASVQNITELQIVGPDKDKGEDTYLQTEGFNYICECLSRITTLTKISIMRHRFNNEITNMLIEAFEGKKFTHIDLWNNSIVDSMAITLAEKLLANPYLQSLNLGENKLTEFGWTKIEKIAEAKGRSDVKITLW